LKIGEKYNAVLLCQRCNNQKSNLLPTKFYASSQIKILKTTYHINSYKDQYIDNFKSIDIENLIDFYENSLNNKVLIYLDYLDYLWNHRKISKYRLKKESSYKFYYLHGNKLQIIYGKIKYNFILGKIVINHTKIRLKDIKGITFYK